MNKSFFNNTVKILGQEYEIVKDTKSCDRASADGIMNYYNKKIYVKELDDMLLGDPTVDDECKENRYKEVLRHEIIHAFLDEAGFDNYSGDENLVTMLAMQFHKLEKIFNDLDI